MSIKELRYDLIQVIMKITDTDQLVSTYNSLKRVNRNEPNTDHLIPVIDIKYGVSLDEIKRNQTISVLTYDDIHKMFKDESWDKSLEELLATV